MLLDSTFSTVALIRTVGDPERSKRGLSTIAGAQDPEGLGGGLARLERREPIDGEKMNV